MDWGFDTATARADSRESTLPWTQLMLVSAAALVLRIALLRCTNADLTDHFLLWLDDIRQHGLWSAVSHPFSAYGYTPFYSYSIGLANALFPPDTDGKIVIKSVSIAFDFVAASLVYALAWSHRKDRRLALAGFAALLFSPTVVLNGACWGQSDIVYTTFLLACLYTLLKQKPVWAMVWFGVAVAIKLQAAWLGPFILMMILRGRIRWYLLAIVPLMYSLLALPAVLAGRSLVEVFTIYLTQAGTQRELDFDAANLQFFPQYFLLHKNMAPQAAPLFAKFSVLFTALLGLAYAWKTSRSRLPQDAFILATLVSVLLVPTFLPHMHNRYFFSADVVAIVLASWRRGLWPIALLMQFDSAVTYITFLLPGIDKWPVPSWLAMLGVTDNLQAVTGLIAIAALLNFSLLIWSWISLQSRCDGREMHEVETAPVAAPI